MGIKRRVNTVALTVSPVKRSECKGNVFETCDIAFHILTMLVSLATTQELISSFVITVLDEMTITDRVISEVL